MDRCILVYFKLISGRFYCKDTFESFSHYSSFIIINNRLEHSGINKKSTIPELNMTWHQRSDFLEKINN